MSISKEQLEQLIREELMAIKEEEADETKEKKSDEEGEPMPSTIRRLPSPYAPKKKAAPMPNPEPRKPEGAEAKPKREPEGAGKKRKGSWIDQAKARQKKNESKKKLTQAQLRQIIKEELKAISEIYDPEVNYGHGNAFNDEWGSFSLNDNLKYGKSPWFSSHFRDQMLQRVEDRLPIPPDHIWRKIERALTKAGLYKPSPEADAFIEDMLDSMREEASARPSVGTVNPYTPKEIPPYWTLQEGKQAHLRKEGMFDWFGGGKEETEEAPAPEPEQEQDFEMPPLTRQGEKHIEGVMGTFDSEEEAYAYYQGTLHALFYAGSEGDEDGRGWIGQRERTKLGWPGHASDREGIGADYNPKHPIGRLAWIATDMNDEDPVRASFALAVDGIERTLRLNNEHEDTRKQIQRNAGRDYRKSHIHNEGFSSYEGDQKLFEGWRKFTSTTKK